MNIVTTEELYDRAVVIDTKDKRTIIQGRSFNQDRKKECKRMVSRQQAENKFNNTFQQMKGWRKSRQTHEST